MRPKGFLWLIPLCLTLASACSVAKKAPPPAADVEGLLKQRADTEAREAMADVNPKLGVKVTWTVQSVQVRPQPGNEAQPYAGTIHFRVVSETPELDGVATERFEKSYEYAWDSQTSTWVPQ